MTHSQRPSQSPAYQTVKAAAVTYAGKSHCKQTDRQTTGPIFISNILFPSVSIVGQFYHEEFNDIGRLHSIILLPQCPLLLAIQQTNEPDDKSGNFRQSCMHREMRDHGAAVQHEIHRTALRTPVRLLVSDGACLGCVLVHRRLQNKPMPAVSPPIFSCD